MPIRLKKTTNSMLQVTPCDSGGVVTGASKLMNPITIGESFRIESSICEFPVSVYSQKVPFAQVFDENGIVFASETALYNFWESLFNFGGDGGSVAFADITGAPTDNLALANKFSEYLRKTAGSGLQTVENDTTFNVPNDFEVFLTGFSQTGRIGLYNELNLDTVRLAGDRLLATFDSATDTSNMNFWDLVMSLNNFTLNANGQSTFNMLGNAFLNTSYGAFNGAGSFIEVGSGLSGQSVVLSSLGTAGQIGVLVNTEGDFVITTPFGDYVFPATAKPTIANLAGSATLTDVINKVNSLLNTLRTRYQIIL